MRIVYSLLLAGLFILGYFLCKSYLCGNTAVSSGAATSAIVPAAAKDNCNVTLKFKDRDFSKSSSDNFRFNVNTSDLEDPSSVLVKTLDEVVTYLENNSGRALTINGLYLENESFDADLEESENLGQARANVVKTVLEEMGAEGDQILTTGLLTKESCFRGDTLLMKGVEVKFDRLDK